MPPGRTAGTEYVYTPTEEELAAMEADLAAAEAVPPPTDTAQPVAPPVAPPPSGADMGMGVASYDPAVAWAQEQAASAPVPAPPPAYNYGAAEPYGASEYAVAGNALAPQSAYSPPPLATVNEAAYLPQQVTDYSGDPTAAYVPPPVAADPYAMDRPGSAVGPLADERYANAQRVAAFQRGQVVPPPPTAIRDNPPGPLRSDPLNNADDSARIARIRQEIAAQDVARPGRIDEQLGNLVPNAITVLTSPYGWGSRLGDSARSAQDVLGGMILDEPAKPTSPAGEAGRLAGMRTDPLIDRAAEALAGGVGSLIGASTNLVPGRSGAVIAPESLPIPKPSTLKTLGYGGATSAVSDRLRKDVEPFIYRPGEGDIRSQQAAYEGRQPTATPPLSDVARPAVDFLEDVVAPQLPWNRPAVPAPTRGANPVIAQPSAAAARAPAATTQTAEQTIPRNVGGTLVDVIWQGETPVGIMDPETGERIALTPEMTQEQVDALFADVVARTPAAPVPTPSTSSSTTTVAPATAPVAAPSTPASSSTTTDSGGGGGAPDYASDDDAYGAGSRSSGRSRGRSDFDDFFADLGGDREREFTAEDFLDAADGDRKRATAMAKAANKKRKRGGRTRARSASGMGKDFPFNRPPSPLRASILAALTESMGRQRNS